MPWLTSYHLHTNLNTAVAMKSLPRSFSRSPRHPKVTERGEASATSHHLRQKLIRLSSPCGTSCLITSMATHIYNQTSFASQKPFKKDGFSRFYSLESSSELSVGNDSQCFRKTQVLLPKMRSSNCLNLNPRVGPHFLKHHHNIAFMPMSPFKDSHATCSFFWYMIVVMVYTRYMAARNRFLVSAHPMFLNLFHTLPHFSLVY